MTKKEALEAMKAGKKIYHDYYSPDEYLYMDSNGIIFTEDGVNTGNENSQFWVQTQKWEVGWFIYEGK